MKTALAHSPALFTDYVEQEDDEVFVLDIDRRFNITDLLPRLASGQVPCQDGFARILDWEASIDGSGIGLCEQYAQELSADRLQVPVICVTLAGGELLVIDGNHRMMKARAAGLAGMPARVIDEATTAQLLALYEESSF
jgi:hypothetical protein